MVRGESQRLLRGRVSVDPEIASLPSLCPGRLVFLDDLAPAELSGNAKLRPRNSAGILILTIASHHGDQARKAHDLAGTSLPMPGPYERTGHGRRNVSAVDLQR